MKSATEITVELNGEVRSVPAGLTVASLLAHLELHPGLVVVERNRVILRREAYGDTAVEQGDTLELVHFVGGG
jgi:thiamine biosynthesis protein ThiS